MEAFIVLGRLCWVYQELYPQRLLYLVCCIAGFVYSSIYRIVLLVSKWIMHDVTQMFVDNMNWHGD